MANGIKWYVVGFRESKDKLIPPVLNISTTDPAVDYDKAVATARGCHVDCFEKIIDLSSKEFKI